MKKKILFLAFALFGTCIISSTQAQAAKYNYIQDGSTALGVVAGKDYSTENGYVGCPETIYGLTVRSIADDGFAGRGSDDAAAKIPTTCLTVGKNAFLTTNGYTSRRCMYLGGAKMPAKFWRYFEYMGFSAYTPLINTSGTIVCDTSIHGATPYNGSVQEPAAYAVYIDGECIGDIHEFLTPDRTNVGVKTVRFPVMDLTTNNFNVSGVFYGTANYEISKYDIANTTVESIDDVIFNGEAWTPDITVDAPSWPETKITKDVDYTVTYENNINAGTAKVILTGINNCTGTKEITFKINQCENFYPEMSIDEFTYSGKAITPLLTSCTYEDDKEMKYGADYLLSYENNLNVGNATVTVTGINNFTGTKTLTFSINPLMLTADNTKCELEASYEITEDEDVCPIPKSVTCLSMPLTKDTDFALEYYNNYAVGEGTIEVMGKGNFDGSVKFPFTIVKKKPPIINPNKRIDKNPDGSYTVTTITNNNDTVSTIIIKKNSKATVTLKWKKVKKAKKYIIYQKKSGKWKKIKTTKKLKYKKSGFIKGKTYKFRIKAVNKKGKKLKQYNKTIRCK